MKILAICQYYYPETFQITEICEELVKDGHEVTVITGLPNYPMGNVPEEYKKGHRKEILNGVKVLRCYEIGRGKGAIRLAMNYSSFMLSALFKVRRIKKDYDIVFCYQLSPVTMAVPAMKYAKKNRAPFLLYCCDLWPESMKLYVKKEPNPIFFLIKLLSKKIYRSTNRIVVQSITFIDYLAKTHNIDRKKLRYIPAFADETYLSLDFTPEGDTVDFVFLGNLGIAQDLFSVLKAVKAIRDVPGFKVHFVGDGVCIDDMKKYVKHENLENIIVFHGRKPLEEMPKYYKLADACLVSLKADSAIGFSLPLKVQGYMAAGKPIIGMMNGSAKEVIDEVGCGICVCAGDIEALSNAMKRFIQNVNVYYKCGKKGRDYFKNHFTKDIFMHCLEQEMEELVNHERI